MSDANRNLSKGIVVLLVLLVVGMVAVFAVIGMSSQVDDPRTHTHQYVAEGVHDGLPVTGSGSTSYYNEGQSRYIYRLTVTCTDSSEFSFTVIMDRDGRLADAYDDLVHVGSAVVDGDACEQWSFTEKWNGSKVAVNLWVGAYNTITKSTVSGAGWDVSVFLADPVSSVAFDVSVVQLRAGSSEVLAPIIHPSHSPDPVFTWSSSDTRVAAVDQNGVVTAVGSVGQTCTVTVTVNGHSATVPVVIVA